MAKLGDVCTIYTGTGFPTQYQGETSGDYPFYKVGDISKNVTKGYVFLQECDNYISEDVAKKIKGTIVPADTVVFAKIGEAVKLNRRAITVQNCLVDNNAMGICPNQEKLNLSYFYHYMCSIKLETFAEATTVPSVKKSVIENLDIPMPTYDEQTKISYVLDNVCELIGWKKHQIELLDELVKARFIELFGDLHSTNFPKCKMADVCGIKHGYAFSGDFFTDVDNNILLVTPGNFRVGGGFQEKKCKFFTGEYSKEYVLNGGDLIVTMTDLSKNMDTLGYSAIVPHTDRVYLHNQRIGLFVNVSEKINRVFLMYFMQTNEYRDNIIASATGSTVHHTSPSKILDCEMFVPPIELQNQFVAFVEQTDKSKLAVQQSLEKLETLKKSLMQKYFG